MKALSKNNENPQGASKPFDKDRDGFILSEGAGMLMLEDSFPWFPKHVSNYIHVRGLFSKLIKSKDVTKKCLENLDVNYWPTHIKELDTQINSSKRKNK